VSNLSASPWIVNQPNPVTTGTYGHDLSCVTDLDPAMLETDGVHALTQAIARRLITARGSLIDDPNYGTNLPGYLNDDLSPADLANIQALVNAECIKDERVYSATSIVTLANGVFTVTVAIVGLLGSFRLTLGITGVSTTILAINQ
jgi:hypothetical protein